MVNCKNCGAPLSLDEAVCPHCGTPNPEAQEHLKKLSKLDKDFKKARKEVEIEVRKSKRGYGVLIILVMLLLSNLSVFILHSASYDIADRIWTSRYDKKTLHETLRGYIRDGEFEKLSIFYDSLRLPYEDSREYNTISYMASIFMRVQKNMSDYLNSADYYSDPLVKACENAKDFVDEMKRIRRYRTEEPHLAEIEKLNGEFEKYLNTLMKLTDEDIASIDSISSGELLVLVSRRLSNEE